MNKILLFIIVLSLSVMAGPAIRLEAGRSTLYDIYFYENNLSYNFKLPIRAVEVTSETYGSFLIWATLGYGIEFKPVETIYKIGQKFMYKHIYFRFEHYCAHPIMSLAQRIKTVSLSGGEMNFYNIIVPPYWWTGAQETISIGVEYKFK